MFRARGRGRGKNVSFAPPPRPPAKYTHVHFCNGQCGKKCNPQANKPWAQAQPGHFQPQQQQQQQGQRPRGKKGKKAKLAALLAAVLSDDEDDDQYQGDVDDYQEEATMAQIQPASTTKLSAPPGYESCSDGETCYVQVPKATANQVLQTVWEGKGEWGPKTPSSRRKVSGLGQGLDNGFMLILGRKC